MHDMNLLDAYDQGELSDAEVCSNLPETFAQDYGQCLSARGILCLIAHYGGASLYVPHKLTSDHQLSALLYKGDIAVIQKLHGGGCTISIPSAICLKRYLCRKRIIALRESGKSVRQVAKAVGVTDRWVQKVTARERTQQTAE